MSKAKAQPKPKKVVTKLPSLRQDFSEILRDKPEDFHMVLRFTNQSLDRLLASYRFAKDEKATDLQLFYYEGTVIFLKDQLDAVKSGVVSVTLLEPEAEEVTGVVINLDYSLLQQVQTTMKSIGREDLIIEISKGNAVQFLLGTFKLPTRLRDSVLSLPTQPITDIEMTQTLPVAELSKLLDISFNTSEASHSALDNIFLDGSNTLGGTKGLLYRTESLLPDLKEVIGFNYKYAKDISIFASLVSGEITVSLGKSIIRDSEKKVLEFMSDDLRLVIPLAILEKGNLGIFESLVSQLTSDSQLPENTLKITTTVKALKRSLECMSLALYNLKSVHKTKFHISEDAVKLSATPLTNEEASDKLSCTVEQGAETLIELGNPYLFDAIRSYEAQDTVHIEVLKEEKISRIKIHGRTKNNVPKSWIIAVY